MMGVLGWIFFGLIVGAIAKLLMPGRDPGGILVTILLGIIGAVVGGDADAADGDEMPGAERDRGRLAALELVFPDVRCHLVVG